MNKEFIRLNVVTNFKLTLVSIISGLLIALGCCVNMHIGGILGALFFACGLVTIVTFKLPLFTGIVAEKPAWSMLIILLGNAIGGVIGHYMWGIEMPTCTLSNLDIFLGGCGTGILMVAAYKSKSIYVAILGVCVFILCGFPHCIAELGYLRMTLPQWLLACAGNIVGGQVWRFRDINPWAWS